VKSFRDGLAIRERLAQATPATRLAARSVAVLRRRSAMCGRAGDLAGALKSYGDSFAIFDRLANPIQATPAGNAV